MENRDILKRVDHSALSNTMTEKELIKEMEFAIENECACLAITPYYVRKAANFCKGRILISAAIGFSRGDTTTATKAFEAKEAIANGATEIDMVANLCEIKNGNFLAVAKDIAAVKAVCSKIPLKVIIETSELNEVEKIKMCNIITDLDVDYIKTSTGFTSGGATVEDVELFKKYLGKDVKIKVSGGVKTRADAIKYIEMGVERIGTKFTKEFIL